MRLARVFVVFVVGAEGQFEGEVGGGRGGGMEPGAG